MTDWQRIGWILLFSVPPGVGMVGFVAVALQRGAVTPVAVAIGVVTTLAVAALVAYSSVVGERDEDGRLEVEYPDEGGDDEADAGES